jgi:hypothetical protein
MENIFLAIIALNALITAMIVGGLALGMLLINRKLNQLETEVQNDVMPKLREFTRLARKVADATADTRRRITRVDAQLTARADRLHHALGGTLDRVAGAAEEAADAAGELESEADAEEATAAARSVR